MYYFAGMYDFAYKTLIHQDVNVPAVSDPAKSYMVYDTTKDKMRVFSSESLYKAMLSKRLKLQNSFMHTYRYDIRRGFVLQPYEYDRPNAPYNSIMQGINALRLAGIVATVSFFDGKASLTALEGNIEGVDIILPEGITSVSCTLKSSRVNTLIIPSSVQYIVPDFFFNTRFNTVIIKSKALTDTLYKPNLMHDVWAEFVTAEKLVLEKGLYSLNDKSLSNIKSNVDLRGSSYLLSINQPLDNYTHLRLPNIICNITQQDTKAVLQMLSYFAKQYSEDYYVLGTSDGLNADFRGFDMSYKSTHYCDNPGVWYKIHAKTGIIEERHVKVKGDTRCKATV